MNNPRLNFLFLRRPKIEYVCPPVCDVVFSSTGFPTIVFPEFTGDSAVAGLVWSKVGGVFRLSWSTVKDAICYTVYMADDPNNPFGSYHVVAECLQEPFYDADDTDPTNTHFKVTVITPTGGSDVDDATPHAGPGGNPGDPTLFENLPLEVEEECAGGGGTFYFTVPAGLFTGWSQFDADTKAFAAAEGLALAAQICLDDVVADACAGDAYLSTITATGGNPVDWLVSAGELPPGLALVVDELDPTEATIEGTPTQGGLYGFTIRCGDPNGNYVERGYQVKVIEITNSSPLPDGQGDAPYSLQLTQIGGVAPLTWTVVDGSLPGGLSLDANTGVISGTPLAGGNFNFTVAVTDDESLSCTKEFDLFINATVDFDIEAGFSILLGGQWSVSIGGNTVANGSAPNDNIIYQNPVVPITGLPVGQNMVVTITNFGGTHGPTGEAISLSNFGSFQPYIGGNPAATDINTYAEQALGYSKSWTIKFEYL